MHIHKRGNTYVYRRRVPKDLIPFINLTEFHRALVPDKKSAKMIASRYDLLFNRLIASLRMSMDITEMIKELDLEVSVKNEKTTYSSTALYQEFLKSKEGISESSYREYKQQIALLQQLLPKDLQSLSYVHIDSIKQTISKLPKRNIQKYRNMSLKELLNANVAGKDRIAVKSQNEYLKTLRALLKFGYEREHISKLINFKLFKNKTSARNQRQTLEDSEKELLFSHPTLSSMSKILYYSGMRLSEIYKCKLFSVEGILCFDLRDSSIELKTESSHRLIPVHYSLVEDIETLLEDAVTIVSNTATRKASKVLNTKGKTFYSLRHTFATELAANGIRIEIIGELLGHAQKSITANRYVKGFPVEQLKKAVDTLSFH